MDSYLFRFANRRESCPHIREKTLLSRLSLPQRLFLYHLDPLLSLKPAREQLFKWEGILREDDVVLGRPRALSIAEAL